MMFYKASNLAYLSLWLLHSVIGSAIPPILPRQGSVIPNFSSIPAATNLTWTPCSTGFFCALLDVPLDYTIPNGARAFIPLVKISATTTPYKGMVLINPGGPGNSGVDFLIYNQIATPTLFGSIMGTNYDLVSFDPRGIGQSTPLANCGSPATKRAPFINKPYGPVIPDRFLQVQYPIYQALGTRCQATIGGANQAGPHMNTAVVVRDMISILDAYARSSYSTGVSNPTLLNFWGISYGSIIGQTFGSMYPDRVGKVVLDGVLEAEDYTAGAYLKNLKYSDEAFATFFVYCHLAGAPSTNNAGCAFYTGNTPHDIFLRFENVILKLDAQHAANENWANATVIYEALVALKVLCVQGAYYPNFFFPNLASILVYFESIVLHITQTDIGNLRAAAGSSLTSLAAPTFLEWSVGIACSDSGNANYNRPLADLMPGINVIQNQSYIFGELWAPAKFSCAKWSIASVGRFTGPYGGNTQNRMLFVGNTRDPVAPVDNALKASKLFKNAQLLVIDGTGHTSPATDNKCGFAKMNAFFQTGKLPGPLNKAFCKLEKGPFGVLVPLGSIATLLGALINGIQGLLDRRGS